MAICTGFVDDLLEDILKSGDTKETFERVVGSIQSDPTLILKIASVVSECGMPPVDAVTEGCREALDGVDELSLDVVRDLLTDVLVKRDVDSALEWLQIIGFVERYLPELEATKHLKQEPNRHHKDVWEHTKLVVKQAIPDPIVRWSALLHDIGKVPTRRFTRNGVTFHGHAEVGARMFDKMCRRFPFPDESRVPIRFLIQHHLRVGQYDEGWTDNAVRRFYKEMDDHLEALLALSRADITSKRPGRRRSLLFQISELAEHIERLKKEDAVVPPLPKGLGRAMMETFGIPPSKKLGDLRKALEDMVSRGEIEAHRDDSYYIEVLTKSGLVESLCS